MEELNQLLDFWESCQQFVAYHCFGDKAKKILSSLQLFYKDICNCNDDLHSKQYLAVFVFTDNAEVYMSEIDAFIKQYNSLVGSIFILDLHPTSQYKVFKDRWKFYNIFTSHYYTLQDNILHFLMFFHNFMETKGIISMDFNDFRTCARLATYITSGTAPSLDQAIYPISPVSHSDNIRTIMLGLELQSLEENMLREDMKVLASFFEQLPENVEVKWQITPKCGHHHTEYIVGFDEDPMRDNDNS